MLRRAGARKKRRLLIVVETMFAVERLVAKILNLGRVASRKRQVGKGEWLVGRFFSYSPFPTSH